MSTPIEIELIVFVSNMNMQFDGYINMLCI